MTKRADLLQQTLDEEKAADEKLSTLAEDGINQDAADAAHPSGSEDDDEVIKKVPAPRARGTAAAARRSTSR